MELYYSTYDAIHEMNYSASHEVTLSGKKYKILTLYSRGPDGSTLEDIQQQLLQTNISTGKSMTNSQGNAKQSFIEELGSRSLKIN